LKSKIDRGYDHGVFIPLILAFPNPTIPIIQISIKKNFNPSEHFAMGKAI
jgi:aromatic ring-opening dioxygenase catalytic subunit (LigB family)